MSPEFNCADRTLMKKQPKANQKAQAKLAQNFGVRSLALTSRPPHLLERYPGLTNKSGVECFGNAYNSWCPLGAHTAVVLDSRQRIC